MIKQSDPSDAADQMAGHAGGQVGGEGVGLIGGVGVEADFEQVGMGERLADLSEERVAQTGPADEQVSLERMAPAEQRAAGGGGGRRAEGRCFLIAIIVHADRIADRRDAHNLPMVHDLQRADG